MSDRGLALILVGHMDRRVLPAITLAASLPDYDTKAVHVAVDPAESRRLAEEWMGLDLGWIPLHIEDPHHGSLLATINDVVEREIHDRSRVLVIVPEVDLDRWWQVLLHRSTGRRIARALRAVRRVSTVVIPYPVDLPSRGAPSAI